MSVAEACRTTDLRGTLTYDEDESERSGPMRIGVTAETARAGAATA